jgi:hypothetical protein
MSYSFHDYNRLCTLQLKVQQWANLPAFWLRMLLEKSLTLLFARRPPLRSRSGLRGGAIRSPEIVSQDTISGGKDRHLLGVVTRKMWFFDN